MLQNFLMVIFYSLMPAVMGVLWMTRRRARRLVMPRRRELDRFPHDPTFNFTSWEQVHFKSDDGIDLVGWFVPPQQNADGATLVFVHGLGMNRAELLDQANMLHSYGYGALLLDLRNHGESAGDITTLGYHEVNDVMGAVNYLKERPEVNDHRIGLIGVSMGGATVLRAAAKIPEIRAVVAQAAYTSITDNIRQGVRVLTGLPPFPFSRLIIWFGERQAKARITAVRPIDDLLEVGSRAVMFIHGELDKLVVVQNAEELFEAAQGPKELYVISQAGHGRLMDYEPDVFEEKVVAFLDTHLRT